ncbi:MAG: Spo0E like sporulation regulatory protein [Firmicutes bacterium]|nr:Spo0E like sporulation regulatory protein [Bacillota bacterium]
MPTPEKVLAKDIECLRETLYVLIKDTNLLDPKILALSNALDVLIVKFQLLHN